MNWKENPCGCKRKPEDEKKECDRDHSDWYPQIEDEKKECHRDHSDWYPQIDKPEDEKKECHRNPCCCPPKEKPEKDCDREPKCPPKEQTHVHEVQGSVMIAEPEEDPHNHRFATVSGEAIFVGNNDHVHKVEFSTDFYEDHYHEFEGRTSGAVWVGDRHVHYLKSCTEESDGHVHEFRVATLIDDPIGE